MKVKDIKDLSIVDLNKKITESETEYVSLKMDLITNALKDTSKISKLRKKIARYKTVLSEKKGVESGR